MTPRTTTRTPADALTDAREANAAADALDAKADDARAAAARIAADNMDAIVEDPDEAVRVNQEVSTQELLANTYTAKAGAERARRDRLILDALALEAQRLDQAATQAEKASAAHRAKVDELLAQLEELDGVSYGVAAVPLPGAIDGRSHYPATRGDTLVEDVEDQRVKASMIRYVLEHGAVPEYSNGLDYLPAGHPLAGRMVAQSPGLFIAPMLAAHRAGTILDYTPED
ncbi:hypothetical protein [Micrococcus luteus]|uniref:hypothetical protein n=1 Tax=Micrococcus luteus TaxID=1270 RepID=UPI00369B74B9